MDSRLFLSPQPVLRVAPLQCLDADPPLPGLKHLRRRSKSLFCESPHSPFSEHHNEETNREVCEILQHEDAHGRYFLDVPEFALVGLGDDEPERCLAPPPVFL